MFGSQKKSWRIFIGNIYIYMYISNWNSQKKPNIIKAMCKSRVQCYGLCVAQNKLPSWKLQKKTRKNCSKVWICLEGTKGVRGRVDSIKRVAPWQLSRNRQGHKCLAPLVQHRFDEYSPRPGNRSVIDWSDLGCRVSQRVQETLLEFQKWKSTRRSWVARRRCTALQQEWRPTPIQGASYANQIEATVSIPSICQMWATYATKMCRIHPPWCYLIVTFPNWFSLYEL